MLVGGPALAVASVKLFRVVDLPDEGLPTRPINGSRGILKRVSYRDGSICYAMRCVLPPAEMLESRYFQFYCGSCCKFAMASVLGLCRSCCCTDGRYRARSRGLRCGTESGQSVVVNAHKHASREKCNRHMYLIKQQRRNRERMESNPRFTYTNVIESV